MTATSAATAVRFHVSLNVSDLERSVAFYRTLFGREPAKRRADYAKFELDEPPLVLSLEPGRPGGGTLNHAGFRLPDSAALVAVQERLERAGIRTNREEGVECCYARQTKFWVTDPDRTLWEMYVLEEDIDHRGAGQSLEAMLPPSESVKTPVSWEHRLGDPFPDPLPHADGTVDEVYLRGTFNDRLDPAEASRILREVRRVLRPGGQVTVHVLTAERPLPGAPSLPGPAAHVRHVPVENEPLRALEEAGFTAIQFTKLGASPCFRQQGVEMRETMLAGTKPGGSVNGQKRVVLYKGPFQQVCDEAGNVYRRGQRVAVSQQTAEALRQSGPAEAFVIFPAAEPDGRTLNLVGASGSCSGGHP
jgi:catechol 2,3-dioxygenase-like lactoylglutathione lyase family enzyme